MDEKTEKVIRELIEKSTSRGLAYQRARDAIDTIINILMRQTIEQKTHAQRNAQIRTLCSDLLRILAIADDDADMSGIPF
jgi:hypothetical protein